MWISLSSPFRNTLSRSHVCPYPRERWHPVRNNTRHQRESSRVWSRVWTQDHVRFDSYFWHTPSHGSFRRYVDFRLISVLTLVYSSALIDRINLGAAYTAGMGKDLVSWTQTQMSVEKLNILSAPRYRCTFQHYHPAFLYSLYNAVSWTVVVNPGLFWHCKNSQLPGNVFLRKIGVRRLLTFSVFAWGLVVLGMSFVHSWGWMVFCRVLLGIFEVIYPRLAYSTLIPLCQGFVFPSFALYHANLVRRLFWIPTIPSWIIPPGTHDTKFRNGMFYAPVRAID